MEISDNPVQAALDERRDQRAQQHRLESDLTLADRCRDAAETKLVAKLATRGAHLEITTSDGSVLCGSLVSLGDRALGFVTGQRHGETREDAGCFDDRVDWVDPTHIVSVADLG